MCVFVCLLACFIIGKTYHSEGFADHAVKLLNNNSSNRHKRAIIFPYYKFYHFRCMGCYSKKNILSLLLKDFGFKPPSSNFQLSFILTFKNFAFRPLTPPAPHPMEFPISFTGVGMCIFWNCTL